MSEYKVFTSESVSSGHPDKLADQISDAVLDALLSDDPRARVACETLLKDNVVVLAGETSHPERDMDHLVRSVLRDAGYRDEETGIDPSTCRIYNLLGSQSPNIAQGVDHAKDKRDEEGAGDQGMMFGYASRETDVLMPAPITFAHRLMRQHALVRAKKVSFLGPDAKCQLSFEYENGKPTAISTIVFSSQHELGVAHAQIKEAVTEEIVKQVIPTEYLSERTKFHINPTGEFVIGGPKGDAGLTGRKIIVDTYGGMAHHGGGAFSGKDPTKVDRSAAYAARYVAKNIVAAGLADRCELQISYAIGVAEPTSISVNTYGTHNKLSENDIVALIKRNFDLRPTGIREMLELGRPIYRQTATYGHFGREEQDFSWEKTDRAEALMHG